MIRTEDFERVEVDNAAALWAWLGAHHDQTDGVWLVTPKKRPGQPFFSRDEVLDALVAHGWIDGIRRKLDETRTMQLISPRKQAGWAQSYRDRAERLAAEGRMHPAGASSVAAAKAAGLWEHLPEVDALAVPEDLAQALAAQSGAKAWFGAAAPSYRRNVLRWIASAKRPPTRARRVAEVAERAARAEKVPQF
jgi:uncharacterized protein YdeI (YjbR/CyaY-like superfamily)